MRDGGATWRVVAEAFDLSTKQARRRYVEHLRDSGQALDLDPGAILRETLQIHVWALDELRHLADTATNDSARVGAARSRVTVARERLELLVLAGVLPPPDHAARLRLEADKRRFAAAVLDAIEESGAMSAIDLDVLDGKLIGAIRATAEAA